METSNDNFTAALQAAFENLINSPEAAASTHYKNVEATCNRLDISNLDVLAKSKYRRWVSRVKGN